YWPLGEEAFFGARAPMSAPPLARRIGKTSSVPVRRAMLARRHDHGRRIERRIFGDRPRRVGLGRPCAGETGRRARTPLRRRLDLVARVARRGAGRRGTAAGDPWRGAGHRAGGEDLAGPWVREAPVAIGLRAG